MHIVFMANDSYADWVRPFLASLYDHAEDATVWCIPYDDRLSKILALQAEYGFGMVDLDLSAIDAFADECFPDLRPRRRNLRKLAAFDMPGPFLYLDCDQLITAPLGDVALALEAADADLVYWALSEDWVYSRSARRGPGWRFGLRGSHLRRAAHFSSGAFAMLRGDIVSQDIMSLVRQNWKLYKRVRHPQVIDQPIINLFCHLTGLRLRSLETAVQGFTGMGFYRDPDIELDEHGHLVRGGARVVSVHWAGAQTAVTNGPLRPVSERYGLLGDET